MKIRTKNPRLLLVLAGCLMVSACSTTATKHPITEVQTQLETRFPGLKLDDEKSLPQINSSEFLTLGEAQQLMLSHSPKVQIALAKLGVADARQLQAELISNPQISISAMRPEGGGRWQLETGLSQPLLTLFTRPLRKQMAEQRVLEVQLELQAELQELILETHTRYYNALAAAQHLAIQSQVLDAAKAQQELALSLYRAGNMAENQFLYYDNELRRIQQQFNRHRHKAQEKRISLLNLMGLSSDTPIKLPDRLPPMPEHRYDKKVLIATANQYRLDKKIIEQQLGIIQQRRALLRQENGWRDLTLGLNAERETDGAKNFGPELEFALPIFNRNQGKLAAVEAESSSLEAELSHQQLRMDLEISQALLALETAQQQLQLLKQSLAVAEKRVDLSQREVNFMLTSPFELLSIKRSEIQLAHDFTNEIKNYWLALGALELAVGKSLAGEHKANEHEEHHHD